MATRRVRTSEVAIESPELVLVDPELRTAARQALVLPGESVRRAQPSSGAGATRPIVVERPAHFDEDDDVDEAIRRLGEFSELEPPERPPLSAKLMSIAFAAVAWVTLAIIVADAQPWRL